jgi:alpha-ketoglutarate-dependent taurine dioxygenase
MVTPDPTLAELEAWQTYPGQTHPLVWHHQHGRPSLVIGATCFYVENMDLAEGNHLLCRLQEYATQDEYVYEHTWEEGDFIIFDNTGTMHKAAPYDLSSKRLMRRTTLVGEEPIVQLEAA